MSDFTKLPKLGSDPMDVYSQPVEVVETKLTRFFRMQVREKPEKPGRSLAVIWDRRNPLVEGFENNYSYTVTFSERGNIAGNHYHEHKQELFYAIVGSFKVALEDIKSNEQEEFYLKDRDHKVLYIPTRVSHVVIADSNPAVLLVVATYPGSEKDEFKYTCSIQVCNLPRP